MDIKDILDIPPPDSTEEYIDYLKRIEQLSNKLPKNFVKVLFRHFDHFKDNFESLQSLKVSFEERDFTTDEVLKKIGFSCPTKSLINLGFFGDKDRENLLSKFHFTDGTWIDPIFVFDDSLTKKFGTRNFHLIDGHLRLGRFYNHKKKNLKESHKVLVMKPFS